MREVQRELDSFDQSNGSAIDKKNDLIDRQIK